MASNATTVSVSIAVGVVCLGLGYFGGREHLKYEMRTAMQSAAQELFAGILGKPAPTSPAAPAPVPAPAPAPASNTEVPKQAPEPAALSIALEKIEFEDVDVQAGRYQDGLNITLLFRNLTKKEIRAFDGVITFSDLLGNEILNVKTSISQSIKPDASFRWPGVIDYNQFMAPHKQLRSTDAQDLKVAFAPRKILFKDGTEKVFGGS